MNNHNNPVKEFFRYMLPTVTAMLVSGLYQIIDGIFIGHYIGAAGLAAVNTIWAIVGILIGFGLMVGVGTGALTSIYRGKKETENASRALTTGFILIILISIIGSVVLALVSGYLIRLQTQDSDVIRFSGDYLTILVWSSPALVGSIAIPFFIRNDESPKVATFLMLIGAIANIVFDYLMIAVFDLELRGAAIATVISQLIVCSIGIAYFCSSSAKLRLSLSYLQCSWYLISQILVIGLSSLFMYMYWGIMVGFHNAQFDAYGGTTALGAYTILGFIVTFYYLTVEGVANSMQPLASFHYGANKAGNIRILLLISMALAIFLGIVIYIVLFSCPDFIFSIFAGDDSALLNTVKNGSVIHLFALCLDGFLVVAAAFYQSVNQGKKAMVLTIGNIIIQPPLLYMLPKWYGLTGVWIAYPVSNVLLSLVVVMMLYRDVPKLLFDK